MSDTETYCIILTTCGNREEAGQLARGLIEKRLAACIQLSEITSFYEWKNKVENDPELLLRIKTRTALYADVEAFIRANHSYEVPEIVQIPIQNGLGAYLSWIDDVTA